MKFIFFTFLVAILLVLISETICATNEELICANLKFGRKHLELSVENWEKIAKSWKDRLASTIKTCGKDGRGCRNVAKNFREVFTRDIETAIALADAAQEDLNIHYESEKKYLCPK